MALFRCVTNVQARLKMIAHALEKSEQVGFNQDVRIDMWEMREQQLRLFAELLHNRNEMLCMGSSLAEVQSNLAEVQNGMRSMRSEVLGAVKDLRDDLRGGDRGVKTGQQFGTGGRSSAGMGAGGSSAVGGEVYRSVVGGSVVSSPGSSMPLGPRGGAEEQDGRIVGDEGGESTSRSVGRGEKGGVQKKKPEEKKGKGKVGRNRSSPSLGAVGATVLLAGKQNRNRPVIVQP